MHPSREVLKINAKRVSIVHRPLPNSQTLKTPSSGRVSVTFCRNTLTGPRTRGHDQLRRRPGGSRQVRPLPEENLRPHVPGVRPLGRGLRGHRLPGLHPGPLVPGLGGGAAGGGMRLEPGAHSQPDGSDGKRLQDAAAEQLRPVRPGLELHGAELRRRDPGPETELHQALPGGLGLRLRGPPVLRHRGGRVFPSTCQSQHICEAMMVPV